MGLEYINSQIEDLRTEAGNIATQYAAEVRGIDNDANLSEAGRKSLRLETRESLKPRIEELREREKSLIDRAISERQSRIESRSGVTSTDIIAFRDAQDRADRIEKQTDALPILDRALRQGDTSLAHAIFRRGLESNWRQVTDRFTADNPDLIETVSELRQLVRIKEATFNRTLAYALLG